MASIADLDAAISSLEQARDNLQPRPSPPH